MLGKEYIENLVRDYLETTDKEKQDKCLELLFNSLSPAWFMAMIRVKSNGKFRFIDRLSLEELKDDFFIRLVSKNGYSPEHKSGATFHSWAGKVINRLFIDYLKKAARNPVYLNERLLDFCRVTRQGKLNYQHEIYEIILAGINSVTWLENRIIFLLYVFNQTSFKSLAEVLDLNIHTVRSRYRKARLEFLNSIKRSEIMFFLGSDDFMNEIDFPEKFNLKIFSPAPEQDKILKLYFMKKMRVSEIGEILEITNERIINQLKEGLKIMVSESSISDRLKETFIEYNGEPSLGKLWKRVLSFFYL